MPVMKLRGGGHYFMINMSDKGEEMVESPTKEYSVQLSTLIEEKIADDDASDPVTDVFLVSHGYKTDRQGAVESYANWMNGMIDQLPKETRFHANHGHTRVLIVGIHWPSWMNDGKPYAAGKLLRDLTLVQQILATLRWPDAAPEVLGAIDRMVNAVAYTPTVKEDLMFLIDLSDGIDAPMDLNGLPEEDLLRMGEDLFGKMLNKQQLGQKLEVKQPSAVPHRKMTFKDETAAAATAAAIDSCHHHEEDEAEPQRRGPFFGLGRIFKSVTRGFVEATRNAQQMVFGKYEERAIHIGSTGLHAMLAGFMAAADRRGPTAPPIRFHGVGHSLGCHVLSGRVWPAGGVCSLPRRMHSLCLIEPAVHAHAMTVGHKYHRLTGADLATAAAPVRRGLIAGALVVTTSATDMALHNYSIWNGKAMGTEGAS
eukprot:TRINITY_DN160_c0_g1_i10.p1 TRINITY_DN160_c0_g1~~TRINITY_DN160_c0_g1_i10.p1  ORF type:complete len:425 (+),score=191.15 TRINITY_DN160_c0_g1_i10:223-1497(+)